MALNLFNDYMSVIDSETRGIDNADILITVGVEELLKNYSVDGLKTADSLNFDRVDLRCAYIYLYSTAHSHMVLHALGQGSRDWLDDLVGTAGNTFNVTSLGGGPGSDTFGILVHLDKMGYLSSGLKVNINNVDEYRGWEKPFLALMWHYSQVEANFRAHNLFQPLSPLLKQILQQTHLLSMCKFLSAISADRKRTANLLRAVCSLLKPGTCVLIIDNAGGGDFRRAKEYCEAAGLEPVYEPIEHFDFKIVLGQETVMRNRYYGKRAQTGSKISMVVMRKPLSMLDSLRAHTYKVEDYLKATKRNSQSNTPSVTSSSRSTGSSLIFQSYASAMRIPAEPPRPFVPSIVVQPTKPSSVVRPTPVKVQPSNRNTQDVFKSVIAQPPQRTTPTVIAQPPRRTTSTPAPSRYTYSSSYSTEPRVTQTPRPVVQREYTIRPTYSTPRAETRNRYEEQSNRYDRNDNQDQCCCCIIC